MKTNRIVTAFALLFLAYSVLCCRLYYVQVWQRDVLSEKARNQWLRVSHHKPLKSSIFDRKGRLLAFSGYADSFYVNPKQLKNRNKDISALCEALGLDKARVAAEIKGSKSYFAWLKRKVTPEEAERVNELKIKGVECVKEKKRFYAEDRLASTLLGIVGLDDQPLSGMELVVNNLRKEGATKTVHGRDAKGRYIDWDGNVSLINPNGYVYLTIDKTIQYIAEKELGAVFDRMKAKWASAIVQDVRTGEILAMAVCPGFSNNNVTKLHKASELTNFAVCNVFEPGSTFKIIPFAASLENNLFSEKTRLDCYNGEYKIASLTIHDHDPKKILTFSEVMEQSSNIGTAQIGLKAGKESVYYFARAFGFGTRTGIALPGEASGILRNPKYWSGVSLPMISFGQEVGVTCIQLISAYSAIANGGMLLEPQIIKRIENEDKQPVWSVKAKKIRRVVSEETSLLLTKIMRGVVERGTGVMAHVDGYTVAGKTGTAQKFVKELNRYCSEKYVASFCGYLPANKPEIAILIVVDEPKGDYWGGSVAAPVFSKIAKQVVSYLNIAPDKVDYALAAGKATLAQN